MCAGSNENWFGLAARPPVVTLGRSKLTKSRILVCAPSNAALDEIVVRVLRGGLLSGAGAKIVPNIVRAGVATRMHSSVSGVTLDSLVAAQVGATSDYHVVRPCSHSPFPGWKGTRLVPSEPSPPVQLPGCCERSRRWATCECESLEQCCVLRTAWPLGSRPRR